MQPESFYRRPLPEGLVAFASDEGRALFRDALARGTMESFFAQAEQFHTQQEPAFCGLSTLVVALNALAIDPGRLWKGPWRWYSEELLDCCAPLDRVKNEGITLDQFACLARCNGATAELRRASESSLSELRRAIADASRSSNGVVLAIAYTRKVLGQTGDGHFSTIAGYHEGRDLALVLDVARFKYPPHWVPVKTLFEAMLPKDPTTGRARGFVVLRRGEHPPLAFRLRVETPWARVGAALRELAPAIGAPKTVEDVVRAFYEALSPEIASLVDRNVAEEVEHVELVCRIVEELRASEAHQLVSRVRGASDDLATMLFLVAPDGAFGSLGPIEDELTRLRSTFSPELGDEIARLRDQLATITEPSR